MYIFGQIQQDKHVLFYFFKKLLENSHQPFQTLEPSQR